MLLNDATAGVTPAAYIQCKHFGTILPLVALSEVPNRQHETRKKAAHAGDALGQRRQAACHNGLEVLRVHLPAKPDEGWALGIGLKHRKRCMRPVFAIGSFKVGARHTLVR